jgi:hypothetical protein
VRTKLEDDEFPFQMAIELKEIVEELLLWLEAYNVIKPTELRELVKNLWFNLPTSSSFNIVFNEVNPQTFTKQLFGAAYALPPSLPPFFLGSFQTHGPSIIFFTNAYRCLCNLIETNPELLYRLFEADLLSHIRHVLLSVSNCLLQWALPNLDPPENFTPALVANDYYVLLFQILKLFNRMMRRVIETSKCYDDPITFSSVMVIFSHILNQSLDSPSPLKKALLNEILGLMMSWFKQERFMTDLLPRITEMLFDLPIKRVAAVYLLMFIIEAFSIREHQKLKDIEKYMFTLNPLKTPEEKTSIAENNQKSKDEIMIHLIRSQGCLLNYILSQLFETFDAKFVSVGLCMLKHMVNTLSHEFAENLVREFLNLLFSYGEGALRIDELDLVSTLTSSPDNKLIIGLCRRLLILNELIPTMLRYALIRSDLIDKAITMFRSIRATHNNPLVTLLQKLFLQTLKNFCTLDTFLKEGMKENDALSELSPSIPQMQKIMNLLSQCAVIDPYTFTCLSNNSISGPLSVLEYLNVIKEFVSNSVGRTMALFGDYRETHSSSPKITVCFKELIDQCYELYKLRVPVLTLVPVISAILDIALELTNANLGFKVIQNQVVDAISCVLAGDSNNLVKVVEKLNDFFVTEELKGKWAKLMTIFDTRTDQIPSFPLELNKSKSIDQLYEKYYSDKLSSVLFEDYFKPKTLKKAESIYLIKHKSVVRKWDSSALGVALTLKYYEKLSDDWLVEHLDSLESLVIAYFANTQFIVADVRERIKSFLAILSEPVKLEVEHDNLLLSIQAVKRRQRIEVEKKRSTRIKATPSSLKINAFGVGVALGKKGTSQQPSRTISMHVDEFERLDKGKRTPFPQSQKVPAKSSTPTHNSQENRTIEPPLEEKPVIPAKYQDIITLLNCYSKTTSKPSQGTESFPPSIFLDNSRISAETIPLFQEPEGPLTEEEKNACKRIQYLRQQKPNDPRTQEAIKGLLKQYKRIEPYVMNTKKT